MDKIDKQDKIVQMMEYNRLTPIGGYRLLKTNFQAMIQTAQTTDYCRSILALQDHNAIDFIQRIGRDGK